MSNYNICFSPTGGTKKVADILSNGLFESFENIDLIRDIKPMSLNENDICLISVPSFGGRVPGIALDRLKSISANGAKVILNCVYGNREWDDTLTELQDALETIGFVCVAAVAAVAEHYIFRQFATGRPDEKDASELAEFAKKIKAKLAGGDFNLPELAGKHGEYIAYNGVPFKPQGNKACVKCGMCAKECPVGAIDFANPNTTDSDKCISCMRCLSACPTHARDFDADLMANMGAKMEPKLGGHKENHLFI